MANDSEPLTPQLATAITELRDRAPEHDLWPAIAPRLVTRRPKGTLLLRWPAALAAGIAIALLSAAGTMLVIRREGAVRAAEPVTITSVGFTAADSSLERTILELERVVRASMAQLDVPARVGIARGLAALDDAIATAAAQCLATPGDPRAEHDLNSSLRKKLSVLRSVSALTARQS